VESEEAEFQPPPSSGVDANMKNKKAFPLIFLTEALASLIVFSLSYYNFTHNNLYTSILTVLEALNVPQQLCTIILPAILLSAVLTLTLAGAFSKICHLSLILLIPSILWFSNLDWLQILGLPINLQFFKTDLPFTYTLYSGLLLISSETLLYFFSQIKITRNELLSRGAEKVDVERVAMKQFAFASTLTALCTLATLVISNAAFLLKTTFQNFTKQILHPYITLGAISAAITIICILAYLRAQAGERCSISHRE
jgi:hypothetical protein